MINKENSSDRLNNEIFYNLGRNFYSGLTNKSIEKITRELVDFNVSNIIIPFSSFSNNKCNKIKEFDNLGKLDPQLREILKKELE